MAIELIEYNGCPECFKTTEALEEQGELDVVYECDCGEQWARQDTETHRCEQCGHFAAKLGDKCCIDCQVEVEDIEGWKCTHCGEYHADAVDAYRCCGESLGEPKPQPVIDQEQYEAECKAKAEKAEADRLERLHKEHPPKYKVGQVIKDIDLGSSGSYNRQAFVDATVTAIKPWSTSPRDPFKWQYTLVQVDNPKRDTGWIFEQDIEYQTGRHPDSDEYRWCCPWTIVHQGEKCKRCGKPFDEISTAKRGGE